MSASIGETRGVIGIAGEDAHAREIGEHVLDLDLPDAVVFIGDDVPDVLVARIDRHVERSEKFSATFDPLPALFHHAADDG